jgi:Uma2 family endonuclease
VSALAKPPMSLEAFLEWERRQELRYEFDGIRAVAMNGGTIAHSEIGTNIVEALRRRLRGGPWRAFRGDLKVIVSGRVRYPDAIVTCSPVANNVDIVPDPVVVFEVLSPSTAGVDRIVKNAEYEAAKSIRHYVMLEQAAIAATVFSREGTEWRGRLVRADAVLAFPELAIEVPLREFYDGLAIPQEMPEQEF